MKALVVEDSELCRKNITSLLASENEYEILEASNGKEAIEVLSNHDDIDVILSDWIMPEMDGMELLHAVRTRPTRIPFIMITAINENSSVLDALSNGADSYILKPFSKEQLIDEVKAVLGDI